MKKVPFLSYAQEAHVRLMKKNEEKSQQPTKTCFKLIKLETDPLDRNPTTEFGFFIVWSFYLFIWSSGFLFIWSSVFGLLDQLVKL